MGKTNKKRATQVQENNVGCTWGLIRMFYSSRRDPKLILDRKQGSRRNSFSGFAGRRRSRNKSMDFEEIDEDGDDMEGCSMTKPTVKRLMEGEGKLKQPKKIPNDEVQRILADLGHNVCLDKSTIQNSKPKGIANTNADISIASSSGSLDPSGSKCTKQAEEDDLELALSDFLVQIRKYDDEGSYDDCRNSELCPELKSLIHTKLNELSNPLCDLASEKILVSEEKELVDNQHLHNRYVGTRLEPRKMIERTNIIEDTKSINQHELAIKTRNKENKNIFFWKKKDKSSRRHTPERSSQPVNKIVILKPNPKGGFCPTVATASTQTPGYSAAECSTFSIKEVRRRFRIVTGENRKGRPSVNEDDVQRDPCRLRDSAFTIKKDSRQVPSATAKNDVKHHNSSKQKQIKDEPAGGINSDISTSKDAYIFYAEARKHLTEILKDKSHTEMYPSPTVQISRSLVRMLSLPQRSASSSPGSSPRVKHCIELSPEDKDICAINKAEREESVNETKKSEEDSGSAECGISEALDDQADQERHHNEEATQHGVEVVDIVCTKETGNVDHSEIIRDAQCISAEQHRYNSPLETTEGAEPGKEHAEMFPGSPENVVEKLEHQEPETPRPSASLEQISQVENHEKPEQPSPVSVLDPFFHEVDSPDNKSMIKYELRQDFLRPQYYPDVESDQGVFWEDKDVRLGYIKAVLELSELCTHQNSEVWYLEDELISTCLFQELHQDNHTDDVKLFFDCICEAITVIKGVHFRNPPCLPFLGQNIQAPPMGQNLVSEINKHIEGHLCYPFPSTLNQLVDMDLKEITWMNFRSDNGEVVVDIWEILLDELLEDVAYDLCIVA